jgi:uncharacterized oxidoreductase
MPTFSADQLREFSAATLHAAGAIATEAQVVADALVEANLEGHDSHGVVRVAEYVGWMEEGKIHHGAQMEIERETEAYALINGNWGWGQVIGKQAMEVGIQKASKVGVAVVSLHNCNHLGRAGDYPTMAVKRGMAAVLFVNTHGGGKLVAPWGGRERRLSANPIAAAIPRSTGEPFVLDISTCAIAGGKLHIMRNAGKPIPPNCIIDAQGRPTTNAADYFGPPEGALLPMAGHKGFGLALMCDMLAGALSGAGCSRPTTTRVGNAFFAVVINIPMFRSREAFDTDVNQLVDYMKSCPLAPGFQEILIPGEPERRIRRQREAEGIPLDDGTWAEVLVPARKYGVRIPTPH